MNPRNLLLTPSQSFKPNIEYNLYGESKEEIEKNLLSVNKKLFREEIEALMVSQSLNIMESIESYCEEKNLEISEIFSLIDNTIKNKLEEYAIKRNLFKGSRRDSLPV